MSHPSVTHVLYGLLQGQNPNLSLPEDQITIQTPTQQTSAQYESFARNTQASLVKGEQQVAIYYDRLFMPKVCFRSANSYYNDTIILPAGVWNNAQDMATGLNTLFNTTLEASDIVSQPLDPAFPPTGSGSSGLGFAGIEFAAGSLGYCGSLYVQYGPNVPVSLATAFPVQECASATDAGGVPGSALLIANNNAGHNYYITTDRLAVSNVAALNESESAAHDGANSTCTLTYSGTDGVYSGSQTIYYNRLDLSTLTPSLPGLQIPVGSASMRSSLLTNLIGQVYSIDLHPYDVVDEVIPAFSGAAQTYTLKAATLSANFVGQLDITLTNVLPAIDTYLNVLDLPDIDFASTFQVPDILTQIQSANAGASTVTPAPAWAPFLLSFTTTVQGSLITNDDQTKEAHGNRKYSLNVLVQAEWGVSQVFTVYYNRFDLGFFDASGNRSVVGHNQATYAGKAMANADWLTTQFQSSSSSESPKYSLFPNVDESGFSVDWLLSLGLFDTDGHVRFTVTPPSSSLITEGALTCEVIPDQGATPV